MKTIFIIFITLIFYFNIIISSKIIKDVKGIDIYEILLNYPINITLYNVKDILYSSYAAYKFFSNKSTNLLLTIQNQYLDTCKLYIYEGKNIIYDEEKNEFSDFTKVFDINKEVKNINLQINQSIDYYIVFQNKEENNTFITYFYDLNENIQLFLDNTIINPFCLNILDFDFRNITFYLPKELNNYNEILTQFKINETDVNGSIYINEKLSDANNYNNFSDYLNIDNNTELKIVYGKSNNVDKFITTEICFNFLRNFYYEISEIKKEYYFNIINDGVYYFYNNLLYSINNNKNISFIIHSLKPLNLNDFELKCYFANDSEIYDNEIDLDYSIKCNVIKDLFNDFHIFFNSNDYKDNKTNIVFKLTINNNMENTLTFIKSGLIENVNFNDKNSKNYNTTGNLVPKIFVVDLEELFNNNKDLLIINKYPDFLRIIEGDILDDNIKFSDYKQIEFYRKDLYKGNKIINVMIYNYSNNDSLNEILFYASNETKLFYFQKDNFEGNYRQKINLKNCSKEKAYFLSKYEDKSKLDNYLIYLDVFYGEGYINHQNKIKPKYNMTLSDIFFNENGDIINSKFISDSNIDIIGINCTSSLLGYLNFYNKNYDPEVINPGKSEVCYLKDSNTVTYDISESLQSELNFSIILLGKNEQKIEYYFDDEKINQLSNEEHIEKNIIKNKAKLKVACFSEECLFQLNIGNNDLNEIQLINSNQTLEDEDADKIIYVLLKNKTENNIVNGYKVYIDADNETEICVSETYGTEGYIPEDSNIQCFNIDSEYYSLNISSPFFLYQSEIFEQKNFMENDDYYFILYKKSGNINSITFNQTYKKEWNVISKENDTIINNKNNLISLNNSKVESNKFFVQISKCSESKDINVNLYENDFYIEDKTLNETDNYFVFYNQKTNTQFEFDNKTNEIFFRFNTIKDEEDKNLEFTDDFKVLLDGKELKFFRMLKNDKSTYEIVVTKKGKEDYLYSLCSINKLMNSKENYKIIKYEDEVDKEINIYDLGKEKIKDIGSKVAIAVIGIKSGNFSIKKLYQNVVYYDTKKGRSGFVIFLIIFFVLLVIIIIGYIVYKRYKKLKPIEQKDIMNEFQSQAQTLTN